ncbi:NAD(P)-binding domain-containing protein [Pseudoscourfieldia marina]
MPGQAPARMNVVVVGASGFVGGAIVNLASSRRLCGRIASVLGVSRSGTAAAHPSPLSDARSDVSTTYLALDVLAPRGNDELASALEGATAVIVSVGFAPLPFVAYDKQVRMNGETNKRVLEAAATAKVPRAVLVNAAMAEPLVSLGVVPRGYYDGKMMAREAARAFVDAEPATRSTAVLKPGPIHGWRAVAPGVAVPLSAAMVPAETVLRAVASPGSTLADLTPVSVSRVAEVAIEQATRDGVTGYEEFAL